MNGPAHLLVVEDEKNVGETLAERLQAAGYRVTLVATAARARQAWRTAAPQLALLDVGLPDGNGFDLAAELRAAVPQTAVVFLTAHGNPEERVRGLELGADDYLTKPFHFRELLLRIQNCLKRAQDLAEVPQEMRGVARIGRARVDFERFSAEVDGVSHALTHKECAVLRLLASRAGKAVSRDEILDKAWSADEFPTSRTVDNFIVRLRKLVEPDADEARVIRSIRGVGYLLTEVTHE
ncbi:MAG: response regulator transcription factor [Gammaproteobacteria bacterium]|nr:response regulator transcription factor [Gammaproteobacteria bacterium]MDE2251635.1 response regulator transcription factor [Gammaproteobacteria bacterium]